MRVSEDRYMRDIRRIHLAQRMIRHSVRTTTICAWTGFNEERIRNLAKSYKSSSVERHRGPPPQKVDVFLRHSLLRAEAACLGGLAYAYRVLSAAPVSRPESSLPGIAIGERLCQTYEIYRRIVPQARLTMEHFILVVIALASQEEIQIARCGECRAVVIVETHSRERRRCFSCRAVERSGAMAVIDEQIVVEAPPSSGVQQPLF